MSQRLLRVRELLKRELSTLLSRDFEFGGALVTVNDVDVTPDLRHGHVFISVLAGQGREEDIVDELNEKHGLIQSKISKRVILKYTPQLHFKLDRSVERGVDLVTLIDSIEVPDDLDSGDENGDDQD